MPSKNLTILLIAVTFYLSARADSILFSTNTTISRTELTYEGFDVTVSQCTLTVAGLHSFNSLLLIDGSSVTHAAGDTEGVQLAIADHVTVNTGCAIDVSGKGFPHDQGPGHGGYGTWGGGGGGYGGVGASGYDAVGGVVYGSATNPTELGSGGGSRGVGGLLASSGGGRIAINVGGTFTIDGKVLADALHSSNGGGGGGSGGSVLISADQIVGLGSIQADGGNGHTTEFRAGGGGGGRISLHGLFEMQAESVHACGGFAYQASGVAGTVFVNDTTIGVQDLTLLVVSSSTARLYWTARFAGQYQIFGTTFSNNDGDPSNGDSQWSLVTTVNVPAGPTSELISIDPEYSNFTVIRGCP